MKTRIVRSGLAVVALLCLGAGPGDDLKQAAQSLRADDILSHIKVLASDAFEGRGPGTPGEDRSVAYLIEQFKALGLKPGNPDGTYIQEVPLVGFQATSTSGAIHVGPTTIDLKSADAWVAVSRRFAAKDVSVANSDVVFVGYGVVAPEYGWDDYKDVDVRGKTIVMLINDPAIPDPARPGELDPNLFKGRAMTYYGRWTYKYEIAALKGAAAALIIHETGPAGYPYEVVVGSWGRENFDIPSPDGNASRPAIEAWISLDTAKTLFKAAGKDFDALKRSAASRSFRPVDLGAKAEFKVAHTTREIKSKNVVAKLAGSDPKLKNEYVVYTAHWDHLGRDPKLKGDQIYNGAADNASGVAVILEIARGFTRLKEPPKRSILFLAVTAEEKGLLGAKYYASNPLYPLAKTLADLNTDVINLWGRTRDIVSVGLGNTTLDDILAEAAAAQGRVVGPDPEPEKGTFYRSDHFEFAKLGVPALNAKGGMTYLDKPADYGKAKRDEYVQKDYHKVTDEVKPNWDLSGAIEDARLLFEVGYRVAQGDRSPEWKPGTEFREAREAMLRAASK
jgi:Zn-dependent M28 family amino/carboxypeptidase